MGLNKDFFFDHIRLHLFGGRFTQGQVDGLNAILRVWETKFCAGDDRWLAYCLATVHHETDKKMQPIEEYGKGKGYKYGRKLKQSGKPYTDTDNIFYGRGYVQLTWYENYDKAGRKLGQDFISHPEKTLNPELASQIMFLGMEEGWFTGKRLSNYFNASRTDWVNARRIINGLDKANLIAGYAKFYYSAISYTV